MHETTDQLVEIDPEDWQQTFARMGIFPLMLFALIAVLQYGPWSHQWMPPQAFVALRNWAIIFLTVSLPLYAWYTWIMRGALIRPIYLVGTAALFGVTAGILCITFTLRALLLSVPHAGQRMLLLRSVQLLDLGAALVVPMLSSFALIMLPYFSQWAMRYAMERVGQLL